MEGESVAYYDPIYQDGELSARAKAVLIYLRDHTNKQDTCCPGINTIAAGVSLSRSTVKRVLNELMRAGLVTKDRRRNGGRTSNLYLLK